MSKTTRPPKSSSNAQRGKSKASSARKSTTKKKTTAKKKTTTKKKTATKKKTTARTKTAAKTKKKTRAPTSKKRQSSGGDVIVLFKRHEAPEDRAQELMYDAWDSPNPRSRLLLALEALYLWPDCADAYVLLAQEAAASDDQSIHYFRQGVAAGERALGKRAFADDVGHFWGLTETRPYMRARSGLAHALWQTQAYDEAIKHYRALLDLNPSDNQGNRYLLLACLLEAQRDDETRALLDRYGDDGTAAWAYARALVEFRSGGACAKSNDALTSAMVTNRYVPPFLTGLEPMPAELPASIGFGDKKEAVAYTADYGAAWKMTQGALRWLRTHAP